MSWRNDATCTELPPTQQGWFFSDDPQEILAAQMICASCAAVYQCLEYAITHATPHGVWGMHQEKDRRTLKRFLTLRPEQMDHYWNRSFEKIQQRIDEANQLAMNLEVAENPPVTAIAG